MSRCLGAISLLILLLPLSAQAELRVGTALRVITPDPLLPISGGMGPTVPATRKQGELTARAAVFEQGDTRVAFVSVDLLGFPSVLCDMARALVPGVPAKNVLIAATHTHSAPDCYAFPDGQGGHTGDLKFMDLVCRRIAEAINEAVENLAPARLRVATGKVEGKVAYNYYAPALYDPRASVIQALDAGGKPTLTLVNYAIHPEVLGNDQGILSPDLVGPLCERIEEQVGGMAMFVNGAQGGMVTADNRNLERPKDSLRAVWEDDRTWDECLRIGRTLADESLRIVADSPVQTEPALSCDSIDVEFTVESDAIWMAVTHSPLNYPHRENRQIKTRMNLVNLGTAQIVTIPGEALPNIGFYLKRKMRGEHNLLFGLTNDALGYLMTKVDYGSFDRYSYITRVSLGEMAGEVVMVKALELVERNPVATSDQQE